MPVLHVSVAGKTATYRQREGAIVCGNNDYRIAFTFDEEWAGYENKTARFIWGGTYYDVDFTGDEVAVPVIPDATEVIVGLYVGELIRTTTMASIPCWPSVTSGGEQPNPGYGGQYVEEIRASAARAEGAADEAETARGEAVQAANSAAASAAAAQAAVEGTSPGAIAQINIELAKKASTEVVRALRKRIVNLEQGLVPEAFVTDATAAYAKTVPPEALSFAQVDAIGGLTHKEGTTLRDTKVTGIKSTGRNLWKPLTSQTTNGVTLSVDERGVCTLNGTCSEGTNLVTRVLLPAGTYTLRDFAEGSFPAVESQRVQMYDETSGVSIFTMCNGLTTKATGTLPETANVLLRIRLIQGHTYNNCKLYPTLVRGADAPEMFTPYKAQTLAIPAAVQALDGYGWGISAELYNGVEWDEDGKATFVKRVGRRTFNGTENWWSGSTDKGTYFATDVLKDATHSGLQELCNKFEGSQPTAVGDTRAYYSGSVIVFPGADATTLDAWKAKLAEWAAAGDPMVMYYKLVTTIVTDVSAYISADNMIAVEPGGLITAENTHNAAAPSAITYELAVGGSVEDVAAAFDEVHTYAREIITGGTA